MTSSAELDFIVTCSGCLFPLLLRSDFRRHYCRFSRLIPVEKKNAGLLGALLALIGDQRFLPVLFAYDPDVD